VLNSQRFPLQLFLVLEKLNVIFWNSKCLTKNAYVCLVDNNWFYAINLILRNELLINNSFLVENTAIDTKYFNNFNNKLNHFFGNKTILMYSYYIISQKCKLSFLVNSKTNSFVSIDKLYLSATWLERETSEMYGILYYNKTDIRKLLLDYSKLEHPLLKDFACEGYQDSFYNFFENQVTINKSEIVEL